MRMSLTHKTFKTNLNISKDIVKLNLAKLKTFKGTGKESEMYCDLSFKQKVDTVQFFYNAMFEDLWN